jgi:hypothetical protein
MTTPFLIGPIVNTGQLQSQINSALSTLSTSLSSVVSTAAHGSPTTFGGLPGSPTDGQPGFITDCNTTTFGAAAAGGGTNHVPVHYNSALAGWRVG